MTIDPPPQVIETQINILGEGTRIQGTFVVDGVARIHGVLDGRLEAKPGSQVILGESGVIEGTVSADTLTIDGFIRGDIEATTRVVVSSTGRVVGNIRTPSLNVEFGAYFEGRCLMEHAATPSS